MNKQIMLVVFIWCIAAGVTGFSRKADTQTADKPGLVGQRFGEADTESDDANEEECNGNPPSLIRLKDGRLCVTYGYRAYPYGIRARLSSDNGKSWSKEIHLCDDGRSWDLGYTRTFQRTDGKLVTIYYYATAEKPEQHIAATIWDPANVK